MARVYASEPFTRRSLREGFVAGTCARNGFFLYSYNVRKYESTKVRRYESIEYLHVHVQLGPTLFSYVTIMGYSIDLHTVRVVRVQYVYLTSYESTFEGMKH